MARVKNTEDLDTLRMALVGYELERQKIEGKIREISAQLGGKRTPAEASAGKTSEPPKRVLSPAARRRIAAAQKKRWAEHRKRIAAAAKA